MKTLKIVFLMVMLSFILQGISLAEEDERNIPESGYINTCIAEVKAGDNDNFETLCVLKKSDQVKIIDKRYSWLKIVLPKEAALYISKDYVDLTSDEKGIGIVNASSVNLRAGPGTRYSILGQVSKPEKLYMISEEDGWYKIEPPYGTTGWVHSNLVNISGDDAEYNEPKKDTAPTIKISKKDIENPKDTPVMQKKEKPTLKLDFKPFIPQGNLSISTGKR